MELNLLEKTELWVNHISLDNANLTEMASRTARVLGLLENEVMVVDVRPDHITFDVLAKDHVLQENILGKEKELLEALASVPGVTLTPETYVHSNGVLGQICLDVSRPEEMLDRVSDITDEIRQNVLRRAVVFPTGFELQEGLIEDANTPFLCQLLTENGYRATAGEAVADDLREMVECLEDAVNCGFGLILTTGGVGAEDKDKTVEAIEMVDPEAATPYILKFEKGSGRHVKDGVRLGVGRVGLSLIVSLPGPHDEVRLAAPVLLRGLREEWDKQTLAERLAMTLAGKWRHHAPGHGHGHA